MKRSRLLSRSLAMLLTSVMVFTATPIMAMAEDDMPPVDSGNVTVSTEDAAVVTIVEDEIPLGDSGSVTTSTEDEVISALAGNEEIVALEGLEDYHAGDIAVINSIIDNNDFGFDKDDPDSWAEYGYVVWDESSPKRIVGLYLAYRSLQGALDVSGLDELVTLMCSGNQLTELNVSGLAKLEDLDCSLNYYMTALDVSGLPKLVYLNCNNNSLTSLSVSDLPSLTFLDCSFNDLTTLNVSSLTSLTFLDCSFNDLTTLNVSALTKLMHLNCSANNLTTLSVSGLTDLEFLSCGDNSLTEITLSGATELITLDCGYNFITALDVSDSTKLEIINCVYNDMPLPDNEEKYKPREAPGITGMNNVIAFNTPIYDDVLPEWRDHIAEGTDPFQYYPQNALLDAEIVSLTPPVEGEAPVTFISDSDPEDENNEWSGTYKGTVTWSPAVSGTFAPSTIYTATITLSTIQNREYMYRSNRTLVGTPEDYFTVDGANSTSNPANSGVITAVFPATEAAFGDQSADNTLKSLTVSEGSLSPVFGADTTNYTVTVTGAVSSITISAEANDVKASIEGAGTKALSVGVNEFNIVVTAENKTTKTYIVNVTRNEPIAYALTVTDGAGEGNYIEGTTATITADAAKEGHEFKEWNITPEVIFIDGTTKQDQTVKFTMPSEAVTATAVYNDLTHYIYTAQQLAAIGGEESQGEVYALANNITLTAEWTPIDDFRGIFDGKGFSVNNLYVEQSSSVQYAGLFGRITTDGVTIKNVNVDLGSPGVNAVSNGGVAYAGGLIGAIYATNITVLNCNVTGDVRAFQGGFYTAHAGGLIGGFDTGNAYATAGSITDCNASDGSISAAANTGGLIGYIYGSFSLSNSYSSNTVYFVNNGGGGLVGSVEDSGSFSINNCFATGDVIANFSNWTSGHTSYSDALKVVGGSGGGLVGNLRGNGTVSDCYAAGYVTITAYKADDITMDPLPGGSAGGLAGYAYGDFTFDRCYATGDIYIRALSDARAGGFIGSLGTPSNPIVNNSYARGDIRAEGVRNVFAAGFSGNAVIAENSYATGEVIAVKGGTSPAYVGGFFSTPPEGGGNLTNCFRLDVLVSGGAYGEINSSDATRLSLAEMRNEENFTDWDFETIWGIDAGINNGFPYLLASSGGEDPGDEPTPDPSPITSVIVTGKDSLVKKGTTRQFSAEVIGENSPSQEVVWTVTGGDSAGTFISQDGLLTVDKNETSKSLNVIATSTADETKYGSRYVVLRDNPPTPVIFDVTSYALDVNLGSCTSRIELEFEKRFGQVSPPKLNSLQRAMKVIGPINEDDLNSIWEWKDKTHVFKEIEYLDLSEATLAGMTELPQSQFYQSPLEYIALPDGMLAVGDNAFSSCSELTEVILPDSLTSLGSNVFTGCTSLSEIHFPAGFLSLKSTEAFSSMGDQPAIDGLAVYLHNTDDVVGVDGNAFNGATNITVYVPESLLEEYEADADWQLGNVTIVAMAGDEQTLSFATTGTINKTYGDATFANVATSTASGATVRYASSDTSVAKVALDGTVTILKPGNVTITASSRAFGSYGAATSIDYTLSVAKKNVTVSAGTYAVSKTYDGTTSAGTGTGDFAVSGILGADSDVTVSGTPQAYANANAGSKTVTVDLALSGDIDEKYQLTNSTVSANGTITKKDVTVTPDGSQTKVYGTSEPALTFSNDGDLAGTDFTGTLSRASGENVGDYAITLGTLSAGANYSLSLSGSVDFAITKASAVSITSTVQNVNMTAYDARTAGTTEAVVAAAHLPASVTVNLNNGNSITLPITWASTTTYNAQGTTYAVVGTLQGTANVDANSLTKLVNITVSEVTATVPTFSNTSIIVGSNTSATASDLGETVLPTSGNITVSGVNIAYAVDWNGGQTLDLTAADNAETFTGVVSFPGAPSWLTLPTALSVSRNVTVVDKTLVTISTSITSKTYTGAAYTYSAASVQNNLVAVNSLEWKWESTDGGTYDSTTPPTNAGDYKVTISVPTTNAQYMGSVEYTFSITKATLNVIAEDKTVELGEALPTVTIRYEGFVGNDNAANSLSTLPIAEHTATNTNIEGDFAIGFTTQAVLSIENYTLSHTNGLLSVLSYTKQTLSHPTGVSVTGDIAAGAELDVKPAVLHADGQCAACDAIRARQASGRFTIVVDIELLGEYKGDVTVSIPVGMQYVGQRFEMLHCADDGTLEIVNVVIDDNGNAVGTFSSLSPFAVSMLDVVTPAPTDPANPITPAPPVTPQDGGAASQSTLSRTSDSFAIGLWITLILIATCGMGTLIYFRKREKVKQGL